MTTRSKKNYTVPGTAVQQFLRTMSVLMSSKEFGKDDGKPGPFTAPGREAVVF